MAEITGAVEGLAIFKELKGVSIMKLDDHVASC